jgi:hypothetical protein
VQLLKKPEGGNLDQAVMPSLNFKRGQAYGGSVLLDTTNLYEHDLIYLLWDELLAELNIKAIVPKGTLDLYIARLDELTE